ncbi:hypothetical protein BRARA_F01087 [Brassica rapa]|uniref:Mediator complex subunit 15 KIX domain-containing protein n=1 Tax=Brassica campestris TaxID=3711 RepID=A0A397YWB3_BRACM|nr:hypothetical protein BRARA_F01087 [Brassica rapa]
MFFSLRELETLKKHIPYSGKEGIEELMRVAVSFEELIFNTATSQVDYLRKISSRMQSMEEGSEIKQEEFSKRRKTS